MEPDLPEQPQLPVDIAHPAIRINNSSFSWKPDSEEVSLHEIELTIRTGPWRYTVIGVRPLIMWPHRRTHRCDWANGVREIFLNQRYSA